MGCRKGTTSVSPDGVVMEMDGSCLGPLEGDKGNISATCPSVQKNMELIQAFVTDTHFASKQILVCFQKVHVQQIC